MTLPLSELREIQEENRLIKIIDATLGVPEFTDDYTPDDYRSAAMQIVTEHGHNPGSEVYDGINNIISFAFDYHR